MISQCKASRVFTAIINSLDNGCFCVAVLVYAYAADEKDAGWLTSCWVLLAAGGVSSFANLHKQSSMVSSKLSDSSLIGFSLDS